MKTEHKHGIDDKGARVVVTQCFTGIAHMQVCAASDATDEEILAVCNRQNPSGTSGGWSIVCRNEKPDDFWGEYDASPVRQPPYAYALFGSVLRNL